MIKGVRVTHLDQFQDERGKVMRMLRADSEFFEGFGEIYFSTIYPGAIKAWRQHREMTQNYAVVLGEIQLILYDDRPGSETRGVLHEVHISPENYCLVTVPPMIWYGFKGVSKMEAVVANCANMPHNAMEIERLPADSTNIPYFWDIGQG